MKNTNALQIINYMLRHLILTNVTDPLSTDSRGYSNFSQYFSGTGDAGQINYLERKLPASGKFIVKVGGTEKTDGVDFDLDRDTLTITWSGHTPADGNDNITVDYTAVKPWIYDDHPRMDIGDFPRITVDKFSSDYEDPGMGIYTSYNSGTGSRITALTKIIIRNRNRKEFYTYKNIHYKNRDLIDAISDEIVNYLQTHKVPSVWEFDFWTVTRVQRISTEEDMGIYRNDISIKVQYYDKS